MEDRYLFKAKRIDNGEWLVGYVVKYGYTGKEKYYIVPSYASDLYAIEIDPSTICQCTGLKDKNCKLIWENDIIECKTENTTFKRKLNGMLIVLDLYFKTQKHLRLGLMQ